jgi:hypothetical protein
VLRARVPAGYKMPKSPPVGAPKSVSVQQVGHAADALADEKGRADHVQHLDPVYLMSPAIEGTGSDTPQDAPLDGHTSLPHERDFQQVIAVVTPVEEEYIPQTGSYQAGESAINADVGQQLFPAPAIPPGQEVGYRSSHENGHAQHESIHTDGEVPDEKQILMHSKILSYTYKSH